MVDLDVTARLRGVIMRLSRQLNASATHEGLTPSQASALGLINFRGPISLSDLAKLEGLNPTMLSRIVGRLEELGLITRRANPADGRSALVEISDLGRMSSERIRAERGQVLSSCLERLPEAERRAVTDALPALENLVKQLAEVTATPTAGRERKRSSS